LKGALGLEARGSRFGALSRTRAESADVTYRCHEEGRSRDSVWVTGSSWMEATA
jgi:hypothetical protein